MRKILLQIFSFSLLFMGIFAFMRFLMLRDLPNGLSDHSVYDIFEVYLYGLGHDMRTLSAMFLPLLLCGFLSYFGKCISNSNIYIYI